MSKTTGFSQRKETYSFGGPHRRLFSTYHVVTILAKKWVGFATGNLGVFAYPPQEVPQPRFRGRRGRIEAGDLLLQRRDLFRLSADDYIPLRNRPFPSRLVHGWLFSTSPCSRKNQLGKMGNYFSPNKACRQICDQVSNEFRSSSSSPTGQKPLWRISVSRERTSGHSTSNTWTTPKCTRPTSV